VGTISNVASVRVASNSRSTVGLRQASTRRPPAADQPAQRVEQRHQAGGVDERDLGQVDHHELDAAVVGGGAQRVAQGADRGHVDLSAQGDHALAGARRLLVDVEPGGQRLIGVLHRGVPIARRRALSTCSRCAG
jgi:hypothetical protein